MVTRFQFSLRALLGLITAVWLIAAWGSEGFAICWLAAMVLGVAWIARHVKSRQEATITLVILFSAGYLVAAFTMHFVWPRSAYRPTRGGLRILCQRNLYSIHDALLANERADGRPAEAYCVNAEGKPLLSWQVRLLNSVAARFKLDEPWDSPNNKRLVGNTPSILFCPCNQQAHQTGHTSYVAVADPPSNGIKPPVIRAIVEVPNSKVPWTKPFYLTPAEAARWLRSSNPHGGFHVLFVKTGEVRFYERGEKLPFGSE
jgi:hypothetical protein